MSAKDLKAHFGRKGHKKESSTHDSSLALDPGSPRGGNTPNLSPRNPSTFVSLCNKDIPWIIEEETPLPQFFCSILQDVFGSMRMNSEQQKEVFRAIDNTLTYQQHQRLESDALSRDSHVKMKSMIQKTERVLEEQYQLKLIIQLQSLVRCYLARKRFKVERDSIQTWKVRNNKYRELLQAEVSYCQHLKSLIDDYLKPLRKNPMKGVDTGSIARVFSNIEELYEVHSHLYEDLEVLSGDIFDPFFEGIGDIFLKYSDQLLPQYENYIENYHTALDTLDILCKVPKFSAFLEEQQKAHANFRCRDKLSLPIQHIALWNTLLHDIVENSVPGSEDREILVDASTIVSHGTDIVRTKLDASERNAQMLALERRVESSAPLNLLANPKRKFLKEGPIMKIDDKKNGYIFLFNDLLLICDHSSGNYKFIKKISITKDLRLIDNTQDKSKFSFEIHNNNTKECKITVKNGPEKASWMADIVTLIHEFQTKCIFGVSLKSIMDNDNEKNSIPTVCERIFKYLEENALHTEGLFRVPGDAQAIVEIRSAFDSEDGDKIDFDKYTVHDVGGVFKLFFREFPDPLFPYSFFDHLLSIIGEYESKSENSTKGKEYKILIDNLCKVISGLPKENQVLLKRLLEFLQKVSLNSKENKMTPQNLAVVFAPNIIRPKEDTMQTALLSPQISKLLSILIENTSENFWKTVDNHTKAGDGYVAAKTSTPKIALVNTDSPLKKKRRKLKTSTIPKIRSKSKLSQSNELGTQSAPGNNLRKSLGANNAISLGDLVKASCNDGKKARKSLLSPRKPSPRK